MTGVEKKFEVARYIKCGNKETAYYETFTTKNLLKAQQKYNEWKNDLQTTRLVIWRTEHGQTEPIIMEKTVKQK